MVSQRNSGSNRFASSKLISMSGLHSGTVMALLMLCMGTHQVRTPVLLQEAAGRQHHVGVLRGRCVEQIDDDHEIQLASASSHFLGSIPIPDSGLQVWIHMPLMG